MLSEIFPSLPSLFASIAILTVILLRIRAKDKSNIPWAPGAIPLLGHALKYKKDPPGFLSSAAKQVGDLFQINMAGKHMIVACGPRIQEIIARAPESIMSARQAVADIGFEETLGTLNVYKGADLHKGIVKGLWHSSANDQVSELVQAVQNALELETSTLSPNAKVEFMQLIRSVILRSTIERFIGAAFLDGWVGFDFIAQFMSFQDDLEGVTAKSAVMPRYFALPLLLWPLKQRRLRLQKTISKRLQTVYFRKDENASDQPKRGVWFLQVKDSCHPDEIAELIVGLLFAAHKNPAIGTAQSYLMLWERASVEHQEQCIAESKTLLSDPSYEIVRDSCPTLHRLCLEVLRLTAHSIGAVRTVKQDFAVGDSFTIPKGSTVALTHLTSSLNDKLWKDPTVLDVDTKGQNRSQELYDNDYMFTVFSHGVHKCPGHQLAMVILKTTVATLLHEYKVTLPDAIPPLCFERATLAQRAGPVLVTIEKRKQRNG